jgi:hypothetical protein
MPRVTKVEPRTSRGWVQVRSGGLLTVLGLSAYVLWRALLVVLAADRGLDLTDEGLYLLAAQPPSLEATWGVPWGWHTAPIFRAVGYDIASFRTLGAFLLVLASGALGFLAVSVGQRLRGLGHDVWPAGGRERAFGAAMGGLAGLLYYGGLVRTPSYNWVTVLGATVAAVGLLQVVVTQLTDRSGPLGDEPTARWPNAFGYQVGVAIAGFGAFFTIPAKPTTPIFFAILSIPVLRIAGDLRFAVRTVGAIAIAAAGFIGVAVIGGLWPWDFVSPFLRALEAPSLLPQQSLFGALMSVSRFPLDLLRDPRLLAAVVAAGAFVGLSVAAGSSDRIRSFIGSRRVASAVGITVAAGLAAVFLAIPAAVSLVHALPADGWSGFVMAGRDIYPAEVYVAAAQSLVGRLIFPGAVLVLGFLLTLLGGRPRDVFTVVVVMALTSGSQQAIELAFGGAATTQFVRPELTRGTAVVAVGLVLVAHYERNRGRAHPKPRGVPSQRQIVFGSASIWLFGVTTGFGSGHGLVRQAALAAGILVAALLLGATTVRGEWNRNVALAMVAALVLPATALYGVSNLRAPYRMEPIVTQNVQVAVGVDGATLSLDENLAHLLHQLSADASVAGWEPGTPLLAVASPWSSALPWHLGAHVPDSLMLTLGGYGAGSEELLDFNLERAIDERFGAAWIMVTADSHERHTESVAWAARAAAAVGRTFPEDYLLVFRSEAADTARVKESGDIELWRPRWP